LLLPTEQIGDRVDPFEFIHFRRIPLRQVNQFSLTDVKDHRENDEHSDTDEKKALHPGILPFPLENSDMPIHRFPPGWQLAGLLIEFRPDQFAPETLNRLQSEFVLFVKVTGNDEPPVLIQLFESLVVDLLPGLRTVPVILVSHEDEIEVLPQFEMLVEFAGVSGEKFALTLPGVLLQIPLPAKTALRVFDLAGSNIHARELHVAFPGPFQFGHEICQDFGLATFATGNVENAGLLTFFEATTHFRLVVTDHFAEHLPQSEKILFVF
jgi:hypothetical protein